MQDEDLVFKALADPVRRMLLDALFERDGLPLKELEEIVNATTEMTRFGVAKHLKLLEGAGLVTSYMQGRQKVHHLNPVPIQSIHERWIGKYTTHTEHIATSLLDLKRGLEQRPDDTTKEK